MTKGKEPLGASKTPDENSKSMLEFVKKMNALIENKNKERLLFKELIESVRFNYVNFCEPDDIHNLNNLFDHLIKSIK